VESFILAVPAQPDTISGLSRGAPAGNAGVPHPAEMSAAKIGEDPGTDAKCFDGARCRIAPGLGKALDERCRREQSANKVDYLGWGVRGDAGRRERAKNPRIPCAAAEISVEISPMT
jgi:hypothetical protein